MNRSHMNINVLLWNHPQDLCAHLLTACSLAVAVVAVVAVVEEAAEAAEAVVASVVLYAQTCQDCVLGFVMD